MAESVSSTIQNLEFLLQQEEELFRNFATEIKHIMDELKNIEAVLKEVKEADEEKDMVGVLQELRLVAFRTEDHLEEFVFRCRCRTQRLGFIHIINHFLNRVKEQHNMAIRIQVIKARLQDISNTGMNESISSAATASSSRTEDDPQQYALFVPEAQLVGINEPKEQLIRWLVEEPDPNVGVVSVFGMGGLGKTTLVKKVYDNGIVRAHFSVCGWANMSQNYDYKQLLKNLMLSSLQEGERMGTLLPLLMNKEAHELKEMLINRLRNKRYFIVIDDIWNLDAWEGIKSALPDSKCGSRIIVTTRLRDIANASVENYGYTYELKLLSPEDSWGLFHKVAFRSNGASNNSADEHLREVVLKFLHKCGGLPLAIVSMAEFLYTKESSDWDAILRNNESLFHQPTPLRSLYATFYSSYNGLPNHLKSCLLYWCLFPEDYVIKCSRLLRLWAGEGFLDPLTSFDTAITKEDVAKHHLDELIARSLIQMQDIDLCGRVRTCRIHNVFREFVLIKARGQDFAEFSSDIEIHNSNIRRLSILDKDVDRYTFLKRTRFSSQIQSFFAYGESSFNSSAVSIFLSGGVKLMKVLDLEGVHLKEFPGEVLTNLYFLRYLGINTEKFSLPSCLGRLVNLETLVLKGHLLFQLPNEILHLKSLRNLLGDFLELPKGICGMTTLEKLNLVVGYDGIDKELGMLTRLRSLCIVCMNKEDANFVLSSLETMAYLRCLYLRLSKPKDNVLDVHNLSHFPPLLQSLTLVGAMNDVPRQIFSLEKLTELKLSYSGVRGSALFEGLQFLPKLVELVLEMDAIDDANLHFRMGSFSKLATLELHGLSKLESIEVVEGAMPCIQNIRFINCPLVEHVPVGIEHLTTLKQIGLAEMASSLEGELRSHHWKAGHSPTVQSFADEFDMDSSIVSSFVDELDTAD